MNMYTNNKHRVRYLRIIIGTFLKKKTINNNTNNKHRVRYLRAPDGKGRKKNQKNKEEKYLDGEAEVAKRKE